LVTLLRLLLIAPFAVAVQAADAGAVGWPASALFVVIAASDVVDGRLARRFGAASRRGGMLDHGADIGFLLTALGTYAGLGLVPWWVPASIAAAFAVYVATSLRRGDGSPRLIASRLGHLGGIANYVLVGILVFNDTVGLDWLPQPLLTACFAAVPVYSGLSILTRLRAGRGYRRAISEAARR
jgi:phosphatidylglycerophosphate synthase